MSKLVLAVTCSAVVTLAATGVVHSKQDSSTHQSGGASSSHSQDDHQRSHGQGVSGDTARSVTGGDSNRDRDSSHADDARDEQVEGADSGSTATSSDRRDDASSGNRGRSQSPSGGGV